MQAKIELFDGIELLSGAYMDYKNPQLSGATIEDIGKALSNVCRFAGHLPRFYSVAQHAVNVARVVDALGGSEREIFAGLMHDTAEAFTNDLPTPLKAAFPVFKDLEVAIESAMAKRFNFQYPLPPIVKQADSILLGLEKVHIKKCLADWACLEGVNYEPFKQYVDLSPMTPSRAYEGFMAEWNALS